MKGPAIRLLLCGVILLGGLLCGAQNNSSTVSSVWLSTRPKENSSASTNSPVLTTPAATPRLTSAVWSTSKRNTTPSDAAPPVGVLDRRELLVLTGGLVLVCVILLLSTLMLTCKVCQMSRHIKMLAGDSVKLTASKGQHKSNPETDAKETSMVLTNLSKTQEEVDRRNSREEGQKVHENGETEDGKQEAEEEKHLDAPCANASAAPSPGATEEQKNVV
ncbi:uncharacterized protein LOC133491892 isoform X2 [Syngnathoides biaculeatus]|uniref:uncharacterized protein LOC133491892 isoform X2 n=1 Tax=Syngnathoides biaculeatus TaxID=300417 RepID=UPI002ADD8D4C|nr:uncharacterized protein LOC133491892 isoform X2 [Syngnathoides biaculeatus]